MNNALRFAQCDTNTKLKLLIGLPLTTRSYFVIFPCCSIEVTLITPYQYLVKKTNNHYTCLQQVVKPGSIKLYL